MKRIVLGGMIALVVLGLAGLGLAVARPDLVPAWARLGPAPEAADDAGLYCKEHGVPEKFCTLCHEELKKTLLLCKEHGDIPEDICTLCHPEVQKKHNIEMCPEGARPAQALLHRVRHGPVRLAATCRTTAGAPRTTRPRPSAWSARRTPVARPRRGEGTLAAEACRVAAADRPPGLGPARGEGRDRDGDRGRGGARPHARRPTPRRPTTPTATPRSARASTASSARSGSTSARSVRPGEVLAVVDSAEVSAAKTQYLSAHDGLGLAQATYDRIRLAAAGPSRASRRSRPGPP